MKTGQKKAAAGTAEKTPAKGKLKFNSQHSDVTNFFQFDKDDDAKKIFVGMFKRIHPEGDGIQGLDFDEFDTEKMESKGLKTLPSYYNLVKFFADKEVNDSVVYQITLTEAKKLEKGQEVFLFEIASCNLDETDETEE